MDKAVDGMDYSDYSRDALLERIQELEMLNGELLKEQEQETRLEYAWTGNLGHWYWNIRSNQVTFNPLKVTTLGYDQSEMPEHVNYQFFTDKLHPEDRKQAMAVMRAHLLGQADVYETEYRIKTKTGSYKWYYDRGRITRYDDQGKPLFLAGIVFDITEKKESQIQLEKSNRILAEMSQMDGLTRISNHRTLQEGLKAAISDADRTGRPLSIAIFDIDNFKRVNDSRGHLAGDQVLVEVAARIRSSIRDTDLAGRYGGEEFMVIFANADLKTAAAAAERIRQSIERRAFADDLSVTISGGVSQYANQSLPELIHEADQKLYAAKHRGKNQIVSDLY